MKSMLILIIALIPLTINSTNADAVIPTSTLSPSPVVRFMVNRYTNRIFNWLHDDEKRLAPQGRYLTEAETAVARQIGVHNPERIRIVVLDKMPLPESDRLLRILVKKFTKKPNDDITEIARTIGYTIIFLKGYETHRPSLSANLKTVQMIEEEGRKAFLKRYLTESLVLGFGNSNVSEKKYQAYQDFGDDAYEE